MTSQQITGDEACMDAEIDSFIKDISGATFNFLPKFHDDSCDFVMSENGYNVVALPRENLKEISKFFLIYSFILIIIIIQHLTEFTFLVDSQKHFFHLTPEEFNGLGKYNPINLRDAFENCILPENFMMNDGNFFIIDEYIFT